MKKRPDIILILSILVVAGVLISNFVIIKPNHKMTDAYLLYNPQTPVQTYNNYKAGNSHSPLYQLKEFKPQEFVHIDSSKQQTR